MKDGDEEQIPGDVEHTGDGDGDQRGAGIAEPTKNSAPRMGSVNRIRLDKIGPSVKDKTRCFFIFASKIKAD